MRKTSGKIWMRRRLSAVAVAALHLPSGAIAEQDADVTPERFDGLRTYSPYANRSYPDQVLFGDMHLHTNLSPDAGLLGTSLSAEDAYRAARGETVMSNSGQPFQLVRPLDFLVVTDHAEYMGLAPMIRGSAPRLLANPHGKWLWESFNAGGARALGPIAEITQIKGDGETHPKLSPEDEFADFERWDKGNLAGSAPKEDWMFKYEYGRSALQTGLELEASIGANPYEMGFNGSRDSHTGLASTGAENFFGKMASSEPSPNRFEGEVTRAVDPALRIVKSQESASGLTGVWARQNTRDEIFDALTRKEVYATTGTRIRVRLFAGWDFAPGDEQVPDFAKLGYGKGVPMGGRLHAPPDGAAPTFVVRALRDPDWANLDRVQIIKGWVGADGKAQERIYDLAVSDGRVIGADGRAQDPVGNTVDIPTATFTNTIGAPMLAGYWKDPDFDTAERAFYYVRVLEIPTPRWTTYDAARFGIALPKEVPPTLQDRAYTSAVWYSPETP